MRKTILGIICGSIFAGTVCLAEDPLRVGVGHESIDVVKEKKIENGNEIEKDLFADSEKIQKMTSCAVSDALKNYGEGNPKLVLIFARTPRVDAVKKGIEAVLPKGVPYIADGSYWHDYTPISGKSFNSQKQEGVLAVALGGSAEIQTAYLPIDKMEVGDWELDKKFGKEKADQIRDAEMKKHAEWGRELAKKFDTSKPGTKLFLQMGTQHVPRHMWIAKGVNEVFDGNKIRVAGGAQADWAWQIHNGEKRENTVYGILISGNFKVAQSMSKRKEGSTRVDVLKEIIPEAKAALGKNTKFVLYFGCAGWNGDNDEQRKYFIEQFPDAVIFGRFNGGELGRYTDSGTNESGADLASINLIGF